MILPDFRYIYFYYRTSQLISTKNLNYISILDNLVFSSTPVFTASPVVASTVRICIVYDTVILSMHGLCCSLYFFA